MVKTTRMTKQKRIILEILRNTDCHPSADWVYEQAKKQIPDISLGTVYRNLNVLKDLGEILELNYGSTYSRYDGHATNHYHFVCEHCNKLVNVDMPVYQGLDKMVQDTMNFQVNYHRMEFYGVCDDCLQSRASAMQQR